VATFPRTADSFRTIKHVNIIIPFELTFINDERTDVWEYYEIYSEITRGAGLYAHTHDMM